MKSFLIPVFFFFSHLLSFTTKGQNKSTELGAKLINEILIKHYGFGLGMQLVRNLGNHSAFETGLYYKVNPKLGSYYFGQTNFPNTRFNESTIMIPLIYRYNTRLINLSAGGTIAYIINYKHTEKFTSHSTGRMEFGATVGLSKTFSLGKSWIFEPELRCSSPIPDGGVGTGLNFAVRKRLMP